MNGGATIMKPRSRVHAQKCLERSGFWCIAITLLVLGAACTPAGVASVSATAVPHLGDIWLRPNDGMLMLFVPSGQFSMGSTREMAKYAERLCEQTCGTLAVAACQPAAFRDEQPAHEVELHGYWIDRTEVTNAQYRSCVGAGECKPPALSSSYSHPTYYGDRGYDTYPVMNVVWDMADRYCTWVGARLPTEAEWEYAARGPEARIFAWGNDFDKTRLNYCDSSCPLIADAAYADGYPDAAPVGSFPSGVSWIGALDMTGNAREWVSDWLGKYPAASVTDPRGPASGDLKITRGGSWYDTPDDVRSANRGGESLEYYRDNLGFRCARDG